jgi:hypothetical protein
MLRGSDGHSILRFPYWYNALDCCGCDIKLTGSRFLLENRYRQSVANSTSQR